MGYVVDDISPRQPCDTTVRPPKRAQFDPAGASPEFGFLTLFVLYAATTCRSRVGTGGWSAAIQGEVEVVSRRRTQVAVGAVTAFVVATVPALAGTNSTTLANGADLSVTVSTPETGDTYLVPAGSSDVDVPVAGSASIGEGEPNVHWTYVIDVSGRHHRERAAIVGEVPDPPRLVVTR